MRRAVKLSLAVVAVTSLVVGLKLVVYPKDVVRVAPSDKVEQSKKPLPPATLQHSETEKVMHLRNCTAGRQVAFEPYSVIKNFDNWKKGTFCYDFFTNTYLKPISACWSTSKRRSVSCFANDMSKAIATCELENVIVNPRVLARVMNRTDYISFTRRDPLIAFLNDCETSCDYVSLSHFLNHSDSTNYIAKLLEALKFSKAVNHTVCERWVEEDTFFFTSKRSQIYFRFLDYFNLHKSLEDFSTAEAHSVQIIRISGSNNYRFPEFDQNLFPEAPVHPLHELENIPTCFRRIILVPRSYSSTLFQCKMDKRLLKNCLLCDGRQHHHTQMKSFQRRVLNACQLNTTSAQGSKLLVTIVSRSPYLRFSKDKLENFQRILANEENLVLRIKAKFRFANVQIVHLENMTICEQIGVAHASDVYLGVHGAGLVHLWWLKEESLAYELEPHFEASNPTFQVLAQVSGCRYMKSLTAGDLKYVFARVNNVLQDLEGYFKMRMSN